MTLKELSQIYYLKKEISAEKARLAELRSRVSGISSPSFSGMPHGTGINNKTERNCAEIADTEAIIEKMIIQCDHERAKIERYINAIPDSLTRQIFRYRFVCLYSWVKVAFEIGGNSTEDNVKKICYRYLEKN